MIVFENDKDRIKAAIRKEAENFCDMIDCVDEPPALDYNVEQFGVTVTISAEIKGSTSKPNMPRPSGPINTTIPEPPSIDIKPLMFGVLAFGVLFASVAAYPTIRAVIAGWAS